MRNILLYSSNIQATNLLKYLIYFSKPGAITNKNELLYNLYDVIASMQLYKRCEIV